jgi:SAM-dependent methyltransferase
VYDKDFYEAYRHYLEEPVVRKNHNFAFRVLAGLVEPYYPKVLDLGCGTGEYGRYDTIHKEYAGIDVKDPGVAGWFCQGDYMQLDFLDSLPFEPNCFVSLFSTECCYPPEVRYPFYERLFAEFPTIRHGMVAGFFYRSKPDQRSVMETGGIHSYQTIEDPADYISDEFIELRVHLNTPSAMFGPDVVEVWKFFLRRSKEDG